MWENGKRKRREKAKSGERSEHPNLQSERDGLRRSERNDDPITPELCRAYRQVLEERISGIKSTIKIVGLSSTVILAIVEILLRVFL